MKVGTKVRVKRGAEHGAMRGPGRITRVSTPALEVKFDRMTRPHKWYTASELEEKNNG